MKQRRRQRKKQRKSVNRYCRVVMSSVKCLCVQQALPKSAILHVYLKSQSTASESMRRYCVVVQMHKENKHLQIKKTYSRKRGREREGWDRTLLFTGSKTYQLLKPRRAKQPQKREDQLGCWWHQQVQQIRRQVYSWRGRQWHWLHYLCQLQEQPHQRWQ